MIPQDLRITLCVGVVCYFFIIIYYLKEKMLDLKYTLVWLIAGVVMGVLTFFPEILVKVVHIFGIQSNMNGLFIMTIGFVIIVTMTLTAIASRTSMKIRNLVQELAMLEKRVRDLERLSENEHSYNEDLE